MVEKLFDSIYVKKSIAIELYKFAPCNYYRRHVLVLGIRDLFQADLIEIKPYEKENYGFRYLITVINVFLKYAWARPIRQKNADEIMNVMYDI